MLVDDGCYVWTWPDAQDPVRLTFDHLRESGEEVKGQVLVETAFPITDGKRGLYHWGNLILSSTPNRETLIKKLAGRTDRNPWALMLELACYKTVEHFRQGEPFVDLATVEEPSTVEYLIDGVIPLGETTILAADGASRKSWIATALAVAVMTGKKLPGLVPLRKGNVLYLDYETGQLEVRRRMGWVCRGLGITAVPTIQYRAVHRALADEAETIKREVKDKNVALVIIDSLGPATMGDLNDAASALRVMNAMRTWSPATNLAIAHVSKASAEQTSGRARVFGSAFYEFMARSVWEVRAENHPTEPTIGLFHRKVNVGLEHEPIGLRLCFNETQRSVGFHGSAVEDSLQLAAFAGQKIKVVAALRHGALSTNELAKTTEIPEHTLRTILPGYTEVVKVKEGTPGRGGSPAVWGLRY